MHNFFSSISAVVHQKVKGGQAIACFYHKAVKWCIEPRDQMLYKSNYIFHKKCVFEQLYVIYHNNIVP